MTQCPTRTSSTSSSRGVEARIVTSVPNPTRAGEGGDGAREAVFQAGGYAAVCAATDAFGAGGGGGLSSGVGGHCGGDATATPQHREERVAMAGLACLRNLSG